jgi:hypothetical protein
VPVFTITEGAASNASNASSASTHDVDYNQMTDDLDEMLQVLNTKVQ